MASETPRKLAIMPRKIIPPAMPNSPEIKAVIAAEIKMINAVGIGRLLGRCGILCKSGFLFDRRFIFAYGSACYDET